MGNKVRSYPSERWAKVKYHIGTGGKDYYFSDFGRLKSVDKETGIEKKLKGSRLKKGFLVVRVYLENGKTKSFFVHKLIAEEWIEKENENQKFVIHIDRDVENIHYTNLKWVSREEMTEVFKKSGSFDPSKRKRNSHYKLNPARVLLLKKRLKDGKTKKKVIAKEFGIGLSHLKKIEAGEMWAWVDDLNLKSAKGNK